MIVAYHGRDTSVVAKVLSGEEILAPSEQKHDRLGPGVYFWEHGPQRAYDWAVDERRGVFVEGGRAFPGAGIMLRSHIQIRVRNSRCILGFFRPNADSFD